MLKSYQLDSSGIKVKSGSTDKVILNSTGITVKGGSLTIYDSTNSKTIISGNSINADFITAGTLTIGVLLVQ